MIKRMIIGVTILFAVLLLMLPKTDDASKRKMASAAMLMCSNDFRKAVAEQVRRAEEINRVFHNTCPKLIAGLDVDESGEVTLRGAQHGVTMVLTPVMEHGELRWSCRGEPAAAIASLCKP